jgi:hypothetical protein
MALATIPTERRRFLMFVGAGVINTCFGYAAFAFFRWVGFSNDLAVLFGMIAGIAFNFGTIGAVFSSRGVSRLPYFLGVYGLLLISNMLALRGLVALGINAYLGEAIIVALLTPISFFAMRLFVFPTAPEPTT